MAKIPPVGTSAYKAYQRAKGPTVVSHSGNFSGISGKILVPYTKTSDKLFGALPTSPAKDTLIALSSGNPFITSSKPLARKKVSPSSTYTYTTSADAGHSGSISAPALDYLNADLAKHYGMNVTTAYNEALSNTSYQRAVKDMQAAGLNPAVLFGNGRVSGADGVYGAEPISAPSGGNYRSFGSSGSSGSGRRHGSSSGKLFSTSTYAMISGLGALAGAGIAAATGGSVGLGALTGSNLATSAAKVLNGLFKK